MEALETLRYERQRRELLGKVYLLERRVERLQKQLFPELPIVLVPEFGISDELAMDELEHCCKQRTTVWQELEAMILQRHANQQCQRQNQHE